MLKRWSVHFVRKNSEGEQKQLTMKPLYTREKFKMSSNAICVLNPTRLSLTSHAISETNTRIKTADLYLAGGDDDSTKQPELFNVANRGLCSMSKAGRLQNAADCSIVLVGMARCSKYNLKGYMMGLKRYPSRVKEVGC